MEEETDDRAKDRERFFHMESDIPKSTEMSYKYDPRELRDQFMPNEKRRKMFGSLDKMFGTNPMGLVDHEAYTRGGIRQSPTKSEFAEWGKKIAIERGIPSYNREMGLPLGQRFLEPLLVSGTDIMINYDDTNFFNNTAMHQMIDDIRRTVIINMDVPHQVIQLRLGKEISPESMNLLMETMQHRVAGGVVVQEHMAEIHPGLTADAYAKVITGDDELTDQFDRRFRIKLEECFHPERAEMLKEGIGKKLCSVIREATIRLHLCDGGAVVRSCAQDVTMSFVSAYKLVGESILSDIAFSTKHAQQIRMGEITWANRARSPNELGGISHGYLSDTCVAESDQPATPFMPRVLEDLDGGKELANTAIDNGSIVSEIIENIWLGLFMSGGIGFPAASVSFTGNVMDDFVDRFCELMYYNFKGHERLPPRWTAVRPFVDMVIQYVLESYEKYPALLEFHWGGAIRLGVIGGISGFVATFMTGDALLGQMALNYAIGLITKEGWLRTGFGGQEVQDHVGAAYASSLRIEEGGLPEIKGQNVPYMSYTASHSAQGMLPYGAMLGRGSAWSASPLVKASFGDHDLAFDFRKPRLAFAKAALREYVPAGERTILIPSE